MAEFDKDLGGVPAYVQPVRPYTRVGSGFSYLAKTAAPFAGGLFKAAGDIKKDNAEKDAKGAMAEYADQATLLADAVDTGAMSSQEARMRLRTNFQTAIANNPHLIDDYTKVHKSIIGTAGLGKVIEEGTDEEQSYLKAQDAAYQEGWIVGEEDPERGTFQYLRHQRALAELDWMSKNKSFEKLGYDTETARIGVDRARVGLQRDHLGVTKDRLSIANTRINIQKNQMDLEDKIDKRKQHNLLGEVADSYQYKIESETNAILSKYNMDSPEERMQARRDVEALHRQFRGDLAKLAPDADNTYVDNMTMGSDMFLKSTMDYLEGKIDLEAYDTANSTAVSKQKQLFLADPGVAATVAVNQALDFNNVMLFGKAAEMSNRFLNKLTSGDPEEVPDPLAKGTEEKREVIESFDALKANMEAVNKDISHPYSPKEEVVELVNEGVVKIFEGLANTGYNSKRASDFNDVAKFIASPEVGEYLTNQGGVKFAGEQISQAKQVMESMYFDRVEPVIRKNWDEASTTITDSQGKRKLTLSDFAVPVFEGERVRFELKPEYRGVVEKGEGSMAYTVPKTSQNMRSLLRDANNEIGWLATQLIKVDSHLNGSTDYQKSFDKLYPAFFGAKKNEE